MIKRFRLLFLVTVGLLTAVPTLAQDVELRTAPQALRPHVHQTGSLFGTPQHRTPELATSEEGRAAIQEYHRLKSLGAYAEKGQNPVSLTPGEQQSFQVLNFVTQSYQTETFTLVVDADRFRIWVSNNQLASQGGFVEQQDWDLWAEAMGNTTPSASYDPGKGIIEINEQVFGPPSDVDGSGKIDVLVHDIQDGFDPGAGSLGFTGGYFSAADLVVQGANQNRADIVHLDSMPTLFSETGVRRDPEFGLQTLAHEYQHLIFAVQHSFDLTFIDEGLAEWAEVVNGYRPRTISYLNDAVEVSRSLLSWRDTGAYGGPLGEDYQRGGLLHHYLAERLGTEMVGSIARGNSTGVGNYIQMLTQSQLDPALLSDLIQGFHVANLINDTTVSPAWGYQSPFRQGIQAAGFQTIDGSQQSTSTTNGNLNPGSVRYVKWTTTGDFSISVSAAQANQEARMRPVLLYRPSFGTMQSSFLEVGGEPVNISGNFDEIYLVLPHTDLNTSATTSFSVQANWSAFSGTSQFQQLTYDTGQAWIINNGIVGYGIGAPDGQGFAIVPAEAKFANSFEVPVGGALTAVQVSMYFLDMFGVSTTSTTRNFELSIYDDNNGEPGNLLLSRIENFTGSFQAPELSFQDVDLTSNLDVLRNHQGTLYVAIGDPGDDDNHIYYTLSPTATTEIPSFLFTNFGNTGLGWSRFDGVTVGGSPAFPDLVAPIRATIDITAGATNTDDLDVLPATVALEQNYPNPFNPSTSIRFQLPNSGDVRLDVHDMLGRRVATLVDGPLTAGSHEVRFDGSNLTSGLYLYSISTPDSKITRTMTLLK